MPRQVDPENPSPGSKRMCSHFCDLGSLQNLPWVSSEGDTILDINFLFVVYNFKEILSFRFSVSTAKYCSKRLPSHTSVMAIHNGKIMFLSSESKNKEGILLSIGVLS